ncbi:MAG: hypothetical protein LKJ83_07705 [Eubacteriaceae bacterium]|jgi:hypothetical protein|nr:hypothetical protein [Eubacteriaceae bacterium]
MFQQLNIISQIQAQLNEHLIFLAKIEADFRDLPDGRLERHRAHGNNYYRIVHNEKTHCDNDSSHAGDPRTTVMIPSSWSHRDSLIRAYTLKAIFAKAKPIIETNIKAMRYFLKHFSVYDPVAVRNSLSTTYDAECDLQDAFPANDIYPLAWAVESYDTNPHHMEQLIVPTIRGTMVRSKSEACIDDALTTSDSLFRYECAFDTTDGEIGKYRKLRTVYPDFIILRGHDRRLLIWEHFGRIYDVDYVVSMMEKILSYGRLGYCPGRNMIITYETSEKPFTAAQAKKIIEEYRL